MSRSRHRFHHQAAGHLFGQPGQLLPELGRVAMRPEEHHHHGVADIRGPDGPDHGLRVPHLAGLIIAPGLTADDPQRGPAGQVGAGLLDLGVLDPPGQAVRRLAKGIADRAGTEPLALPVRDDLPDVERARDLVGVGREVHQRVVDALDPGRVGQLGQCHGPARHLADGGVRAQHGPGLPAGPADQGRVMLVGLPIIQNRERRPGLRDLEPQWVQVQGGGFPFPGHRPHSLVGMATTRSTQPSGPAADQHDVIRVTGARENNLKDISVEIPKRRLTVFTGVSGSGKSSLVFSTIAAESQRLINETYSAFVQGFMPTLSRPDVDVLEGLTTAIIVDQQRMGADPRSTVGTATDAHALLRILFSRFGKPYAGPPNAFSFNVASISGAGAVTLERAGRTTKERRSFSVLGGMCPPCEGRGTVNDIDLTQLYNDELSLKQGALTIPGYSMDGWYGRIFTGCGFFDPDKPIRKYTKRELGDLLHKERTKI